jgi:hypothetical protein
MQLIRYLTEKVQVIRAEIMLVLELDFLSIELEPWACCCHCLPLDEAIWKVSRAHAGDRRQYLSPNASYKSLHNRYREISQAGCAERNIVLLLLARCSEDDMISVQPPM